MIISSIRSYRYYYITKRKNCQSLSKNIFTKSSLDTLFSDSVPDESFHLNKNSIKICCKTFPMSF